VASPDVKRTTEAVWRIESARLIAGIARLVRDVGLAEDLAQEALVAALEQWPESGVPDNPGAWLMATGKHRAIDRMRRAEVHQRKTGELGRDPQLRSPESDDLAAVIDDPFDDDLLRLVFTACHPVLSTDARVALTLRLLCGLTTKEIARAYLTSESTVAQRIVREAEAATVIETTIEHANARGEGLGIQFAQWARAVLYNGLGRYDDALAAARQASDDTPQLFLAAWALPELIEAAIRTGDAELARRALERFTEAANASDSDWGLGVEARSRALLSEAERA
jgi:RNA polymerase sigma factor (sigma-70 family)